MKKLLLMSLVFSFCNLSQAKDFPLVPEPSMTMGKLCDLPVSYRYPEQIAYCDRLVSYELKVHIMETYDNDFGYRILNMERVDFKIDHLIPLCAGGSNDITNLWPQHKSVYKHTDELEALTCEKMKKGTLMQFQAVELMLYAKTHLHEVSRIKKFLNSL